MLVIYVDDLKMAGPSSNMAEGWAMLREVLDIDDPRPVDLFLGCQHEVRYGIVDKGRSDTCPSGPVSIMTYNMEAFFRDCVRTYVELTGHSCPFRKVSTPFLPEDQRQALVSKPASDAPESSWNTCPWCKHQYVGGCAPKVCTLCSGIIRARGGGHQRAG